jgi:YedE family putative selenium metabolism protein
MKREYWQIGIGGLIIGAIAVALMKLGNPPNMGLCIACFERDIAGAIGLHRAPLVQYIRPEIIGLFFGAMLSALAFKEFKPAAGSAPSLRFFMGMFSMIGALVFLGCPLRMTIRLGGGDLNALTGLIGFIAGIFVGTLFLKRNFDLGATKPTAGVEGWVLAVIMLILLIFLITKPVFNAEAGGPIFFSKEGPGSKYAPWVVSLVLALIVGFVVQRTRFCTVGGFRDLILFGEPYLFIGWVAVLIAVFVGDLAFGMFKLGFEGQPIAHTMHLWNALGLFLVGLNGVLLGGCPLRQITLAAQGNGDSAVFVLGMIVGGGIAHNFMLAAAPDKGVNTFGQVAVILGIIFALIVGFTGIMNKEA